MKNVIVAAVIGLLAFQAVVMGDLVNLAPSATYHYPSDWPGSPGRWSDTSPTSILNDNNKTNLTLEDNWEPIVAIFDLGADYQISQITVFAVQTPWNNNGLSDCSFYANTAAQGDFPTRSSLSSASWATAVGTVDKTNSIWTIDTGVLSSPITARYIGINAGYNSSINIFPGITEVGIYQVPEPATLVLLLTGLAGLVSRKK